MFSIQNFWHFPACHISHFIDAFPQFYRCCCWQLRYFWYIWQFWRSWYFLYLWHFRYFWRYFLHFNILGISIFFVVLPFLPLFNYWRCSGFLIFPTILSYLDILGILEIFVLSGFWTILIFFKDFSAPSIYRYFSAYLTFFDILTDFDSFDF